MSSLVSPRPSCGPACANIKAKYYRPFQFGKRSPLHLRIYMAAAAQPASVEALREANVGSATKEALLEDAVVYATQNGLVVGLGNADVPAAVVHAPVAITPVSFPRTAFLRAKEVMELMNILADNVSRDSQYLLETLSPAARYDDFTARLLDVHERTREVRAARADQELALAINRSDYMLDEGSGRLLQVELNTIASSFGCLSTVVSSLHRYMLGRAGRPPEDLNHLPPNNARGEISGAIAAAVSEYGVAGSVVVMVVQPGERNAYDQQWIQTTLWEEHRVQTLRATLAELAEGASVDSSGALQYLGRTVSVVYFRAGYAPTDYPTAKEWEARELLETSTAALCPSVAYQLAGAKKVQQDLARPGVLERFVGGAGEAERLREHFAGLWGLDNVNDPETAEVLREAAEHPDDFVLKPQREGGGNNLYGEALRTQLQRGEGLAAYILMQRIRPPINMAMMARNGGLLAVEALSEVGIFGTFLRRGNKILLNKEAGHLVRTKAATSDEGGVAAGFAVLDSPYLVDDMTSS